MQSEALLLIVNGLYFGGENGQGGIILSDGLEDAVLYPSDDEDLIVWRVQSLLELNYKVELARLAVSPSESVSDL